jgi:aminoglycoside phosphotransferase (APT) family kinase protein
MRAKGVMPSMNAIRDEGHPPSGEGPATQGQRLPLEGSAAFDAVGGWLQGVLNSAVIVTGFKRLSGGAIQENWVIEATVDGVERSLVLRCDAAATIDASHGRAQEFALLNVAHASGVRVPRPIGFCSDSAVIGIPFAVMEKAEGVGFAQRIIKDMALGGDREALTREIGRQMAIIHDIRPPRSELTFLAAPSEDPLRAEIATLRQALDRLNVCRPALEWGLVELEDLDLPRRPACLTHRDLRTGNYMVDESGLTAILDWEFAGWGDPMADLGWFCARCWRFGRPDLEAGGIGTRASLYAGYERQAGYEVDDRSVRIWEIMAHLRWAIVALQQGARHQSGVERSLELALTGRIVPELELAILLATSPAALRNWKS